MINRDMLYTGEQRTSRRNWVVLVILAALVSLGIGLLLGGVFRESPAGDVTELEVQVEELQSQLAQQESQLAQLQSQLDAVEKESETLRNALAEANLSGSDLRTQLADSRAMASAAESALSNKESELATTTATVGGLEERNGELMTRVETLQGRVDRLDGVSEDAESHRLLLVELRRDPPDTREEAFAFWSTMRDAAVKANPALSSPVDRVILKIDNFFDWADRSPNAEPTSDEYVQWLGERVTSGASGYQESADSFFKEALLSAITQLEAIVGRLN